MFKIISGLNVFLGETKERLEWFKGHFENKYENYSLVIPERCHAETSFGFLARAALDKRLLLLLGKEIFISAHNREYTL